MDTNPTTPDVAVTQPGWAGRCFEDFVVGHVYEHQLGRTITSTDNMWFSLLTMNTNPLHVNHDYASHTQFGRPLVNSCLTLALATGMSVPDVSQNAVANLGWDEVRLPHPLFEGDTLYARSQVLETRPSKSHPEAGIVRIQTTGYNQAGVTVIEYKRAILVYRRGHVPARPQRAESGQSSASSSTPTTRA